MGFNQCLRDNRKGKLIPDKDGTLWCKQHHPDTVKAKDDERQAEFDAQQAKQQKRWDREAAEKQFCEGVPTKFLKANSLKQILVDLDETSAELLAVD